MFYSMSIEESNYNIFELFVRRAQQGNIGYKNVVDNVVKQTTSLVNQDKDLNSIDSNYYSIVVLLSQADPDFFKSLDAENIQDTHYSKILTLLEKQKHHQVI